MKLVQKRLFEARYCKERAWHISLYWNRIYFLPFSILLNDMQFHLPHFYTHPIYVKSILFFVFIWKSIAIIIYSLCQTAFNHKAPSFSLAVGMSLQVCDWPRASGTAERGGSTHQSDSGAGETSERDDRATVCPIWCWWWRGEHKTGLTSELVWACQQPSQASWSRFKPIIHDSFMLQASACYNLSY